MIDVSQYPLSPGLEYKINPEEKALLVEALKSGEYKQGRGRLMTTYGDFCCLGVATDVAIKKYPDIGEWKDTLFYEKGVYFEEPYDLSRAIKEVYGFQHDNPTIHVRHFNEKELKELDDLDIDIVKDNDGYIPLTVLNDAMAVEFSFHRIAELIDAQF